MRSINVLISSTLNWNDGDDWIRMGCENVLQSVFSNLNLVANPIIFNRNPDLMTGPYYPSGFRGNLLGDYLNEPKDKIDLVVAAGSPEWSGPAHKALHKFIFDNKIPYLMMGIGTVAKSIPLTPLDTEVFAMPTTYIYTRSKEAAEFINQTIGLEKAEYLGCPAVFCTMGEIQKDAAVVQVPQTSYSHQRVPAHILSGLRRDIPMIVETVDELMHYKAIGFKDVRYSYDPRKILELIGRYKKVVTTRLHAAIAAIATGGSAVLVADNDFRIKTAAEIFQIPIVNNFEEAFKVDALVPDRIKWKVYFQYKAALTQHLKEIFK